MADGLEITIDSKEIDALLQKMQLRAKDMRPVLAVIGQALESAAAARFETRTDPTGKPWAKKKDGSAATLIKSQTMLNSLNWQIPNSTTVQIGFNVGYAQFHETGTQHMQRRGLLTADPDAGTLGAQDTQTVLDALADYFA